MRSLTFCECSGELEREERIAARGLVQRPQGGPWQDDAQPILQQRVNLVERQRLHSELGVRGQHPPRCEHELRARLLPDRDQDPDRLAREPLRGERECLGGRMIEPLEVVDRNEHRLRACQRAESPEEAEGHGAPVDRPLRRRLEHQRCPQRVRLGAGSSPIGSSRPDSTSPRPV